MATRPVLAVWILAETLKKAEVGKMRSLLTLVAVMGAFAGAQANASTIQPAQYFTHLTLSAPLPIGTIGLPNDSTAQTNRSFSALGATLSVTNDFDVPLLQASASVPTGIGGTAQSILNYFIRVDGPGSTVMVNLQALGGINISATSGIANANLHVGGLNVSKSYISCNSCIFGGATLNVNETLQFTTGQVYSIQMQALLNGISGGVASAFIDPMFTVPLGYTIDISENIGNSVAQVPLPAALPLFATVLAGGALVTWRRKKRATQIAA